MVIRKVDKNDIEELAGLFNEYRIFYKKESNFEAGKKFISERITNNDSQIFVAENNGEKLVGFVQLYPLFSSTRMKPLWLLNDLFVAPAFRGKRVSIALLEKCKELCRQSGSCGMILETAKENVEANSLYEKTGFVPDAHHNYYEWEIT